MHFNAMKIQLLQVCVCDILLFHESPEQLDRWNVASKKAAEVMHLRNFIHKPYKINLKYIMK